MNAHCKTISKGTNHTEILADGNELFNTCGYPGEEISHSTEKQEEDKEAINVYQKYKKRRKRRNNLHKRGKRSNKLREEKSK
jgi:hypothetical protein